MDRADFAGAIASVGIFLFAFGVGGSASLDTPVLGEVFGLSPELSFRIAGVGLVILLSVLVAGSYLKEDDHES